jgi:inner membrane protein
MRPVDPVTHSLVGATLSRAGLRRTTPLATATLVIAANAPDIDVLVLAGGPYASLALRRGVTHGPLALLALPFVVTAIMLGYDRLRRRRAKSDTPAARAGPLFALALLGVATHAPLDWLNTYGVRLLSPLSDRWFYGDAVFIIDPWIWLLLGAAVVAHTRTRRGWLTWFSLGVLATGLLFVTPGIPLVARVVWTLGISAIVGHVLLAQRTGALPGERAARAMLVVVAVYIAAMIASDITARGIVRSAARERGIDVRHVMVAPLPANPFASDVVVQTPSGYQLGAFGWLADVRVRWTDAIPEGPRNNAVLGTLLVPEVREFLRWSRFPYAQLSEDADGPFVRWKDARYPGPMRGGLGGVMVRIDATSPDEATDSLPPADSALPTSPSGR